MMRRSAGMGSRPLVVRACLSLVVLFLGMGVLASPGRAQGDAAPSAPAAPPAGDPSQPAPGAGSTEADGLSPPPVVDPKKVETQPITPGAAAPFVREEVLSPVPVLTLGGTAKWDDAYDTLVSDMKALDAELARLGLKRAGDAIVVYTASDDDGFTYEVQLPFSGVTAEKPSGNMKLGASYAGKVFRFAHSGAFTDMDNTYEMIANYLDEKNIAANDLYMEQYRTDLVSSDPAALKIDILVPVP